MVLVFLGHLEWVMPIKFECPNCHRKLTVADAMAGKKGKCPACGNAVAVPTSSAAPHPPVPPVSKGPSKPAPPLPGSAATPVHTNGSSGNHKPVAGKPAPPKPPPPKLSPASRIPGLTPALKPPPTPPPPPQAPPPADVEAEAAAAFSDEPVAKPADPEYVEFECDFCSEPVKIAIAEAGKRVPCPSCRRIIKVPEPKKDKKDWRDPNAGLPAAAKKPDGPEPEGQWGAGNARRVGLKELEEEGILPTTAPPRTLRQRITTWVWRAAGVGILVYLALAGYDWWHGRGETAALQAALKWANSQEGSNEASAAVREGALRYYRRTHKEGDATEANNQFGKALTLLRSSGASDEGDFVLMDLATGMIDLGGTKDDVYSGKSLKWEEVHKSAKASLLEIRSPQVRLQGLHQVARRLLARQEIPHILPLASQVFTTPYDQMNALAELGLDLVEGGAGKEHAESAFDQAQKIAQNIKDPPRISSALITLAVVLNKQLPKVEAGQATGTGSSSRGSSKRTRRAGPGSTTKSFPCIRAA